MAYGFNDDKSKFDLSEFEKNLPQLLFISLTTAQNVTAGRSGYVDIDLSAYGIPDTDAGNWYILSVAQKLVNNYSASNHSAWTTWQACDFAEENNALEYIDQYPYAALYPTGRSDKNNDPIVRVSVFNDDSVAQKIMVRVVLARQTHMA